MPKDSLRLLYIYLRTDIHELRLTIRPGYISNWNSRSSYINLVNHWRILSYFFFRPLFLRVSTALTTRSIFSGCLFDFRVGRTNPGTYGAALTSCCSGDSGSSMPLLGCISDSSSAAQSSSLSFGLYKSPFQFSQSSVSKMFAGALSWSLSTGWRLILRIRWTFKIWVRPAWRSFADKADGKGDLSDNLNAATPSCWRSDQDAVTISSVSEMYPTAVICLFWTRDSFWVAHRFWLPCHISKKSWTFISKKHFRPGGMAASEWTRSVRAIRDTLVVDYFTHGVNTTRHAAYCPPIAVAPFLLALSVSYFKQTLWRCGQLWPYVGMGA